ncbi:MAG: OmpP1/FadL family transporter [Oceanihabitans sp.]
MKKKILACISILFVTVLCAQNITDALRYSNDEIHGTARFRALSGAFGALGGDMSSVSINPAGSSVFNTSHFTISLSNLNAITETNYFNGSEKDADAIVDLNQAGAAFVFNNKREGTQWKKFTIGVAYDKINDYEKEWFVSGVNTNSSASLNNSVAAYFLEYANGLRLDEISRFDGETYAQAYEDIGNSFGHANQQAFLGYESYILEPLDNTDNANTVYNANIGAGSFNHEYDYKATGFNGKFTMNASTQFGDNLFLGLNLNTHFINYERYTYLFESNNNTGSIINEIGFENRLKTTGTGFSAQLGAIWKLNEQLRLGFTYNTPTWFSIEDETEQYLGTTSYSQPIYNTDIDPRVLNVFPDYKLKTPGKLMGSIAYVFGNNGLISFDYALKDYSNTKFKPTSDAYFSNQNKNISNNLTTASTYKVGGEYRIKQWSIRGGYRFEESPYKNGKTIGDLTGYSMGLGYNLGKLKLDLTFDTAQQKSQQAFYDVGFVDTVNVNTKQYNITTSVSFNL